MYNILVADDEQLERIVLRRTLEETFAEQVSVSTAANGREAIQAALTAEADVAILDIEMPGINGLEAARRILDKLPRCKIVMLTAYSEFSYAKEALSLGSADYLLKPCDDAELFRTLTKLFAQVDRERDASFERECLMQEIQNLTRRLEEQLLLSAGNMAVSEGEGEEGQLGRVKREIEQFVSEHYHEDMFLPEMAKTMNYSIAHFSRLFKQLFQRNFIVYLTDVRISAAREFLRETDMTIREISERVGYSEPNYFTKVFRKAVGQSPTEYRETKETVAR
jgi:YesN/AraC family two-component response regulator